MSLPSLQLCPISTSHFYISGDVVIQDGAVIAPGVLIQADPGSQIIIRAGVCIGIGSILHAHDGLVEIGEGANIGAEVLLIGQVLIGAKACIGSATTILNSVIERGQVVPPGSLIGDTSRPQEELQVTDTVTYPAVEGEEEKPTPSEPGEPTPNPTDGSNGELKADKSSVSVYGQVYVNRMMFKMFPNQQRSGQPPDSPSLPQDPWDD